MIDNTIKNKNTDALFSVGINPEIDIPQDNTPVERFLSYVLYIYDMGAIEPYIQYLNGGARMLLFLHYRKRCHPSQISTALRLSRPHVASLLKELQSDGLVNRETDKNNRRQVFVTLTEKGENTYKQATEKMVSLFTRWFKAIGQKSTDNLIEILALTANALHNLAVKGEPFSFGDWY